MTKLAFESLRGNDLWQEALQNEKKRSSKGVCRQAGISKRAFYLFFESKEALFCEVLCSVQGQICDAASRAMERQKDKYGVAKALKLIYREYDKNNFLYHSDPVDFTIFMNRLTGEQIEKFVATNNMSKQLL